MAKNSALSSLLIFIIALLMLVAVVVGQTTTLSIAPLSNTSPSSSPYGVPMGSSIVFTCTPSVSTYTGTFTYTELHAQVSGSDLTVCSASSSGSCVTSVNNQFSSRTITVYVPTSGVGTTFTMTSAVNTDSLNYYCKIGTTTVLYAPTAGTFPSSLLIYALPSTPTCAFSTSTSVFVTGTALPNIICSANVGAPYGWLAITSNGGIGTSATTPFPSFLYSVTNNTVLQSNGTYLMTYTLAYQSNGSPSTYTLTSNNNGDYFTCYAYNSYGYTYYPTLGTGYTSSSPLTITVQSPISAISVISQTSSLSLVSSGTNSYSLSVTQGATLQLYCSATGYPAAFAWTRTSGSNTMNIITTQTVTLAFVYAETLVLQCNASNTITAVTPNYGTSQVATVTITITATTTSTMTTTTVVAVASVSGGAIAGIVIGCVVALALIIVLVIWCTRCPPGQKKQSKAAAAQLQPTQSSNFQAASVPTYESEEKKMPLSMTSDMDVPYGDGTFDDSPRSRKPIVDPHAQSAAEYLDLRGGAYGAGDAALGNAAGYNASQPTTPNGMSVPPTYPGGGNGTLPRGGYDADPAQDKYGTQRTPNYATQSSNPNAYGTQPANPAYGTMNGGYGNAGAGGGFGTMA